MRLPLAQVAEWVGGATPEADVLVANICSDSKKVQPGDLFVAIEGKRFDGHQFVSEAARLGAVAVLASRPLAIALPQVVVPDTVVALGRLAQAWRASFSVPVIAVAGSNGKSTVKNMLSLILKRAFSEDVVVTPGNFNNHIGVPLTLLKLRHHHRCAVVELGANAPGEIRYLASLARPTLGVIINAGWDHIAGFGGIEGAANVNGEMFSEMEAGSKIVLNGDDACFGLWATQAARHSIIRFSLSDPEAAVWGQWQPTQDGGKLAIQCSQTAFTTTLALLGRHNGANALAAASVALSLNVSPTDIMAGIAAARPVEGRLQMKPWLHNARLIDDSYNANPSSLMAALDVLTQYPEDRLLLLGDMGELGEEARHWHQVAGKRAREAGVNRLFGIGELAQHAVEAFGPGAQHFSTLNALADALNGCAHPGLTVLVKASRHMQLDCLVEQLTTIPASAVVHK